MMTAQEALERVGYILALSDTEREINKPWPCKGADITGIPDGAVLVPVGIATDAEIFQYCSVTHWPPPPRSRYVYKAIAE
jgi:hypothetical protein